MAIPIGIKSLSQYITLATQQEALCRQPHHACRLHFLSACMQPVMMPLEGAHRMPKVAAPPPLNTNMVASLQLKKVCLHRLHTLVCIVQEFAWLHHTKLKEAHAMA